MAVLALVAALATAAAVQAASSTGSALKPPPRLGAYVRAEDAKINRTGPGKKNAARIVAWSRRTAAALAAAYGGAAAGAQDYSDDSFENLFLLLAVRAPTPRPVVPYVDAAYLGLVRPPDEVRSFGAVSCVLHNDATATGHTPAPDSVHTVLCQRSGPHLTVQLRSVSGDLGNHPDQVARLVGEAFASLS
jgi:hypothetical protein